jgi:S-adenosylmethionine decarboxylase
MAAAVSFAPFGTLSDEEVLQTQQQSAVSPMAWPHCSESKDYFKEEKGLKFAGTHLILDLWDAKHLDDLEITEQALRDCVTRAGATLLHIHLHHFTPNGGISGVAVLSESHISIHSWPERGYAALDVFMCGDAEPHKTIQVLREAFEPSHINVIEHKRGLVG